MGLFDRWREARGAVMRRELEDINVRMRGANASARAAFLNNIDQTIDHCIEGLSNRTPLERKQFLKSVRQSAQGMWARGDWPSALGLGISCLNAESHHVPGDDAAYVRSVTDQLIEEARSAFT